MSSSGRTVVTVSKNHFSVYKLSYDRDTLDPKYVGYFEKNGDFKSGRPVASQGRIMSDLKKRNFECAAVTDDLLVIGTSKTGCLLFFSLMDADQCRCIFKAEHINRKIRKLLFNSDGTELAVLFSLRSSKEEKCYIYSVDKFPQATWGPKVPNLICAPDGDLDLDMTYKCNNVIYRYEPRDAKFSFNGRKIVVCTGHYNGTALALILAKDDRNTWSYRHERLEMKLDTKDVACLGFTGVSL